MLDGTKLTAASGTPGDLGDASRVCRSVDTHSGSADFVGREHAERGRADRQDVSIGHADAANADAGVGGHDDGAPRRGIGVGPSDRPHTDRDKVAQCESVIRSVTRRQPYTVQGSYTAHASHWSPLT